MKIVQKPLDALGAYFPQMVLAFTTGLWAFLIMMPFDAFLASPGYAPLSGYASEQIIGVVVTAVSFANLHSIITENWPVAQHTATLLMVFWGLVGITFLVSAPTAVSWVLLLGMAWLFGWSAVEAKQLKD